MNVTPVAVASANFKADREGETPDLIVIHTMVGTVDAATARFGNPGQQVSAHYGVGLDGRLYQWVSEDGTAYHAGDWSVNLRSIGIEHEDGGDYNGVRPDALYTASAALVRDICARRGIPVDRQHIVGHREVHATACPDALDIDRIVREAQEDDMTPEQVKALVTDALTEFGLDAPTFKFIKDRLAKDAHHKHITPTQSGWTSEPVEPPVPGATYTGAGSALEDILWTYPDGTQHWFHNGVAIQKP